MALAIATRSELQLHVFHDERSASFAALGIGLSSQSGRAMPAILLCTSGTAAVEFHAAVVEANYASVPMLVCTADRPPELQGVGAAQTIDQQNLYGASARLFVDAGVADDTRRDNWRKLAQEVLSAAIRTGQMRVRCTSICLLGNRSLALSRHCLQSSHRKLEMHLMTYKQFHKTFWRDCLQCASGKRAS